MTDHNHLTRDIKAPGVCPKCNEHHAHAAATEFIDRCIEIGRRYAEEHDLPYSPPPALEREQSIRGVARQTARWMSLWPPNAQETP